MRHRIRIQPYVTPEIHRKLRAYSAANDLTDSAVAEAALGDFLEPDGVDEALIMRRLDGIAQVLAQLQHDLAVVSQAVGIIARESFFAPRPTVTKETRHQADRIYRAFLERISRQLSAGVTLAGEVRRASASPSQPSSGSDTAEGQ